MTVKPWMRVAGWNAVFIFGTLILAEIIFGTWFFGSNFRFLTIPRNMEIRHDLRDLRPGGGIALYRKDKYGLRGYYGTPSDIHMLVVGGSTTNEFYMGEGETWVDILAQGLRRHGRNLRLANAGIDGHSSVGHIRSFEAWFPQIPGLKPTYVLFYVGINDAQLEYQEAFDRFEDLKTIARLERYVKNNSALYNLVRILRGWLRASRANIIYRHTRPPLRPVLTPIRANKKSHVKALGAYAIRLRILARAVRKMGAMPIFVTQQRGGAFVIDGVTMANNSESVRWQAVQLLYNETMMTTCRDVRAICIDLASEIKFTPEDFSDLLHTTASGSRKIGELLADRLKNLIP